MLKEREFLKNLEVFYGKKPPVNLEKEETHDLTLDLRFDCKSWYFGTKNAKKKCLCSTMGIELWCSS